MPSCFLLLCAAFFQVTGSAPGDAARWLAQAQQHFERQQWEECRRAALKALEINPRLGDAEVLVGLVATAQSQLQEAEKHFLKAVSLQPKNPRAQAYLGSTYLQQKRLSEAGHVFRKVLELDPRNATANYNLGLIDLLQGNPAAALAHFELTHQADPSDVPALIGVLEGQLLLKRNDNVSQSVRKLEALLEVGDPRLLQVGTMLALHGHYASAIAIMERVREAFPGSPDVNYNLALAYYRLGRYDKAAETLQPSLNQTRGAEAYNLLGSVEESRNRPLEAVQAFRKASELEPVNEDYRFDYANAVLQHQGPGEAASPFAAGARDFPKSWRMRVGEGATYYLAGQYDEAARVLLEAIKIDAKAKLAYYLLGHTYEAALPLQATIADVFRAYLQQKPDDPWAYYHYGTVLYLRAQSEGQPDFNQAQLSLQKALELNPSFAQAHLQLGIIAQSENRYQECVRLFERAIELDPKLATAHYRVGIAYQRLGNTQKARAELDLFQELKSASEAAERALVVKSLSEKRR